MVNKKYKIAIIHDSFTHIGGAEKVLLNLIDIFPKADIFTSIIKKGYLNILKKKSKGEIYYSKLSKFKYITDNADLFKPFILIYWQTLKLNKYDLVISSSHSFSSNWVNVKGKHISYIYTPPRYLYDEYNEMFFLKKFPFKQLLFMFFNYLRKVDYKNIKKIDLLIACSKNVQNRISKYYHRKSIVIYPPIDIYKITKRKFTKKYYVFFSRLVSQKGGELAIKSFNKNGKRLLVVGKGKEENKLKNIAKSNIKFLGFQPDNNLSEIFSKCKALIYCSIDEDFGIIPLEAMARGIPVIAYKSGGLEETVIENKTGLFFNKYDSNSLNKTINKFENMKFNAIDCQKWAKKFNKIKFKKEILDLLNNKTLD